MALDKTANKKKFEDIILDGNLETELTSALRHADRVVQKIPLGKAVSARSADDVKKGATGQGPCLFSATLSMLDLTTSAMKTLDTARMGFTIGQFETIPELMKAVGTITINCDSWEGTDLKKLHRFDKDAEVQGLCLLLYWAKGTDLEKHLKNACADLVFDAQPKGTGSKLASQKVIHVDLEEKKKQTMGCSSWRKCLP